VLLELLDPPGPQPGKDQLTHPRVGGQESESLAGLREPPVSGDGRPPDRGSRPLGPECRAEPRGR
jgi:hypothetical protein